MASKSKNLSYFNLFFSFNEIIGDIFPLLADYLGYANAFESFKLGSFQEDLFVSVSIAPLIETFLAQYLPFVILRRYTQDLILIYVLSATLFAVGHTYSNWYMIATFVIGFIFIGLFAVLSKKGKYIAFWGVTGVHALSNLIAVIYQWYWQ
ncbi:CPBP family glutamic-type intramembrane protease [Arundinibacter roseus]|uniref:CPBP family intramembrane metalloprotease n=1 Tax=Arundinibacter roseus TaxID=2070510 RepID=A0A4R4K4M4_9BACT|nr:CPBP family glutamic-type intramembrane protease [Arundinibacter roseus]TDB62320.1 CPBP family intramembrane metalloprotease [Arundinibacter roseus]